MMKRLPPVSFLIISTWLVACSKGNSEKPDSGTIDSDSGVPVNSSDGGAPVDAIDGAADASVDSAPPWQGPRVVVVVWPGLRPDMITTEDTPTLDRFRKEGIQLGDHHAVFPTTTMANAMFFSFTSSFHRS